MLKPVTSLPDDIESLKKLIVHQQSLLDEKNNLLHQQEHVLFKTQHSLKEKDHTIVYLREQLNVLLHKRYGSSSEANAHQLRLFNEAECPDESEDENETESGDNGVELNTNTGKRCGRKALPDIYPRVDVIHDLDDADKICPHDGTALKHIGDETTEQLDIIPASIQVIKHIRRKYACPCCNQHIKTAALPKQPIPKSQVSVSTLAWVATNKYGDGLPLYRQQTILSRLGVELPRASLAHQMIQCGELAQPLINLSRDKLMEQPYLHMDETPVQVLKEPDKRAQSKSYMWVQAAGPPEQRIILFNYDPSRSQTVPSQLLAGYRGAVMVDGYEGYNAVCEQNGLTRLGCWAHARRKFTEAQQASGKKGKSPKADYAIKLIGKLYQLEKSISESRTEERYAQRQAQAKPILEKLHHWCQQTLPTVPPKSALGKALHYLHHQWPRLIGYLENGDFPIDNNRVENAIRPFAIGRKNWMFSNSQAGANASANLYSLIETAKANGIEPYHYLKHVFSQLPKAQSVENIEALLPWNFKKSQPCG